MKKKQIKRLFIYCTCKIILPPWFFSDGPDILTEPLPGDQFVTIDGKKTYFDIGPPNTQNGE